MAGPLKRANMDLSIDQLFASLQSTQATKSTIRLSERNVVELIIKLKQVPVGVPAHPYEGERAGRM